MSKESWFIEIKSSPGEGAVKITDTYNKVFRILHKLSR